MTLTVYNTTRREKMTSVSAYLDIIGAVEEIVGPQPPGECFNLITAYTTKGRKKKRTYFSVVVRRKDVTQANNCNCDGSVVTPGATILACDGVWLQPPAPVVTTILPSDGTVTVRSQTAYPGVNFLHINAYK
jgi:hypothetical protein